MIIIETRPDLFVMLFQDKAEFQTELIKLLLEEDSSRDVRFAGLVEDFSIIYNNKRRLFYYDDEKVKVSEVKAMWNIFMKVNFNPIYMIRYMVVQSETELREYKRLTAYKYKKPKNQFLN